MHTPYVFHGYLKDDFLLIIESSSIYRTVQILHHHSFLPFFRRFYSVCPFFLTYIFPCFLWKKTLCQRDKFLCGSVYFKILRASVGVNSSSVHLKKKKIVRHFAEKPNLLKIVLYFINQWNYYAIMIEISEYQTKLLCKSYSEKKMTGFSAIVILF